MPTIGDSKTNNGTGNGTFTSSITGLLSGITYYVRAYGTNSKGTNYGDVKIFTTAGSVSYYVGQAYGGGIVFYVDSSGQHGLIASTSDQGTAKWGCLGNSISGTQIAIGTGATNTANIIANCGEVNIAAKICDNLVLNGQSDWFLPSQNELMLMYQYRNLIGGLNGNYYWSSTENGPTGAVLLLTSYGSSGGGYKGDSYGVRAIRAF